MRPFVFMCARARADPRTSCMTAMWSRSWIGFTAGEQLPVGSHVYVSNEPRFPRIWAGSFRDGELAPGLRYHAISRPIRTYRPGPHRAPRRRRAPTPVPRFIPGRELIGRPPGHDRGWVFSSFDEFPVFLWVLDRGRVVLKGWRLVDCLEESFNVFGLVLWGLG